MTTVMTTLADTFVLPTQRTPLDQLRVRLSGGVVRAVRPRVRVARHALEPRRPDAARRRGPGPYRRQDVAQAVRFAGAHGLTAGVQATGHGAVPSLAGHLLVSTRGARRDHRPPAAAVGAGRRRREVVRVVEAVAPYGLAAVSGSSTDVGIVGYTTGGGVGPMARTYGLAADKVRAIEVVTGDGELRRATPDQHPDLFFALRGGKGAAGIVTAIEFDLIEMPTFYGGSLLFDGGRRAGGDRALAGLVRRAAVGRARRRSRSSSCPRCPACRRRSPVG